MEANNINIELNTDKLAAEQLFSKQDLAHFNLEKMEVPSDYFDTFSDKVLDRISKNKPSVFYLTTYGKMAIAAVFIFVMASAFIFLNNYSKVKSDLAVISIQDISNEEIESYVNANEWIAEMDWQTESVKLESDYSSLSKDTID